MYFNDMLTCSLELHSSTISQSLDTKIKRAGHFLFKPGIISEERT